MTFEQLDKLAVGVETGAALDGVGPYRAYQCNFTSNRLYPLRLPSKNNASFFESTARYFHEWFPRCSPVDLRGR